MLRTPRIGQRARAFAGAQDHRAGAVAEQHAGRAVGPVHQPRHGLGADHQNRLRLPGLDEIVGHRQRIDEARAHRLHIEGSAARHAQPRLHARGGGGKGFVRRRRGADDEVEFVNADAGIGERRLGRLQRQIGRHLAIARDVAAADAGALDNPFVGGVDALGQFVIGDDIVRADRHRSREPGIGSHSRYCCSRTGFRVAVFGGAGFVTSARSAMIFGITSARAMSMAMSSALAKPIASVPPWLFTTTPLRPRKMPPLEARGSSLRRSAPSAPLARTAADAAEQRTAQRRTQEMHDELGRAFGGLQRDIAGETVGHDDVDRAFGNVVAFDEAGKFHRQVDACAGSGPRRAPIHGPSSLRSRH